MYDEYDIIQYRIVINTIMYKSSLTMRIQFNVSNVEDWLYIWEMLWLYSGYWSVNQYVIKRYIVIFVMQHHRA